MKPDLQTLAPERQARVLDEACRQSLLPFVMRAFGMRHPGGRFHMAPYIDAICHQLERLYRGDCKQLIITVPPRHGKSEIASIGFPAWALGLDPGLRFMVASYGHELSDDHLEKTRELLSHNSYHRLFPGTRIQRGKDTTRVFGTAAGGGYRAVSTRGAVTGFGANIIIIDDLHKADEALTPERRLDALRFYQNTLGSRFDDPANARTVVIQQRLHEDDIVGWLLAQGGWHHLNLPAVAEKDEIIPLTRGRMWHRRKGDLLDPVRFPPEFLEGRRRAMGNRSYGAQYQNNPVVADGGYIRLGWFGQYDEAPERNAFNRIVQSWDTASTDRSTSDFSVGMTWGRLDGKWHLLDLFRGRPEFPELFERVMAWHRRWKADALIIEAASSGHALYQEVRRAGVPGLVVSPTPRLGKLDRVDGKSVELASGEYLLPADAPWLDALRHELVAFPDGRNDDQVDALVQFLEFVSGRPRWSATSRGPDGRIVYRPRPKRSPRRYR